MSFARAWNAEARALERALQGVDVEGEFPGILETRHELDDARVAAVDDGVMFGRHQHDLVVSHGNIEVGGQLRYTLPERVVGLAPAKQRRLLNRVLELIVRDVLASDAP